MGQTFGLPQKKNKSSNRPLKLDGEAFGHVEFNKPSHKVPDL